MRHVLLSPFWLKRSRATQCGFPPVAWATGRVERELGPCRLDRGDAGDLGTAASAPPRAHPARQETGVAPRLLFSRLDRLAGRPAKLRVYCRRRGAGWMGWARAHRAMATIPSAPSSRPLGR